MLRAPFPWFGGKSRAASLIWDRFGDVANYIEPFFGSGAVLLARPTEPRIETVNDLDCFVANFWRATQADPEAVAKWADWPVNEADLHARHRWLVEQLPAHRERMMREPEYFDAKIAGFWVWGLCQWIGTGWCVDRADQARQRGHGDSPMIPERLPVQLPHLGNAGLGCVQDRQWPIPNITSTHGAGAQSRSSHRAGPHRHRGSRSAARCRRAARSQARRRWRRSSSWRASSKRMRAEQHRQRERDRRRFSTEQGTKTMTTNEAPRMTLTHWVAGAWAIILLAAWAVFALACGEVTGLPAPAPSRACAYEDLETWAGVEPGMSEQRATWAVYGTGCDGKAVELTVSIGRDAVLDLERAISVFKGGNLTVRADLIVAEGMGDLWLELRDATAKTAVVARPGPGGRTELRAQVLSGNAVLAIHARPVEAPDPPPFVVVISNILAETADAQ